MERNAFMFNDQGVPENPLVFWDLMTLEGKCQKLLTPQLGIRNNDVRSSNLACE
jgi:hypothetical protein